MQLNKEQRLANLYAQVAHQEEKLAILAEVTDRLIGISDRLTDRLIEQEQRTDLLGKMWLRAIGMEDSEALGVQWRALHAVDRRDTTEQPGESRTGHQKGRPDGGNDHC